AEDGIRDFHVTGVQTCALPIYHVLCVAKPYSWTRSLLRDLLPKFGVACSFVDGTLVDNFEQAIAAQTRLIILESPNSMTFEQQDLAAVAALARARSEEHTSELQSRENLVCRLLL